MCSSPRHHASPACRRTLHAVIMHHAKVGPVSGQSFSFRVPASPPGFSGGTPAAGCVGIKLGMQQAAPSDQPLCESGQRLTLLPSLPNTSTHLTPAHPCSLPMNTTTSMAEPTDAVIFVHQPGTSWQRAAFDSCSHIHLHAASRALQRCAAARRTPQGRGAKTLISSAEERTGNTVTFASEFPNRLWK